MLSPTRPALLRVLSLVAFLSCSHTCFGAQTNAPKCVSIRVLGLSRFTEDQVLAASGLKVGLPFDPQRIDAAVEKLGKSGAFAEINYSYSPQGSDVAVQLKVKEETKFHPCLFENFVWISESDLNQRLRKDVSLYVGVAPETGSIVDDVAQALEKLSQEKGVSVQVSHTIQGALGDPNWNHLYKAIGASVKIQSVSFTGNLSVSLRDLQHEAAPLVGRDYSSVDCNAFAKAALVPFYRERGYLQVQFAEPTTRVLSSSSAEFSVDVDYAVSEGHVYRWAQAEWKGNASMGSSDLDTATTMKSNDLANGIKIDEAWLWVGRAYGRKGFIDAKVSAQPVFDEQSLLVRYRVTLLEGPQYHMGQFSVTGVPPDVAAKLKAHWRLLPGDIFDASYLQEFSKQETVSSALQGLLIRNSKIKVSTYPNREQHTVDVVLQLE